MNAKPGQRIIPLLLLAASGCAHPLNPEPPPVTFQAGSAVVEITPREGKPVYDPLFAKALWLETPDASCCIVTCNPGAGDPPAAKLERIVKEAREAKRPARLAFTPKLNLLLVTDEVSRPIAILANCVKTIQPSETPFVTAGWPGAFQRKLEAAFGAPVLFTCETRKEVTGTDDLARQASILLYAIEKTQKRVKLKCVERGVVLPQTTLPEVLEIGGVRMVFFPDEPDVETCLEIKRRLPDAWIVGRARLYRELGEGKHAQDRLGQPEGGRGENHDRR